MVGIPGSPRIDLFTTERMFLESRGKVIDLLVLISIKIHQILLILSQALTTACNVRGLNNSPVVLSSSQTGGGLSGKAALKAGVRLAAMADSNVSRMNMYSILNSSEARRLRAREHRDTRDTRFTPRQTSQNGNKTNAKPCSTPRGS